MSEKAETEEFEEEMDEPAAEEAGEACRHLSEFFAERGWHDAAHAVLGEYCEM